MENYERVRMLGKGSAGSLASEFLSPLDRSYGKAWLVTEKTSKQQFVIKEIRVQNQKEMDEALAEAEVLSKLHHINIIK
jgi:serine/threonine protein kinase